MELIKAILSRNLEDLKVSRHLNNKQVAEAIGVHHSTYGRWENGTGWIDSDSLEKLAAFYGVRSSRFFLDPELEMDAQDTWINRPSPKDIKKALQNIIETLE